VILDPNKMYSHQRFRKN